MPLAIPGYMIGTWRWFRNAMDTWQIGSILALFFFAWYIVLRVDGGSQVLVPFALLAPGVGFGVGWLVYWREHRARRERRARRNSN